LRLHFIVLSRENNRKMWRTSCFIVR